MIWGNNVIFLTFLQALLWCYPIETIGITKKISFIRIIKRSLISSITFKGNTSLMTPSHYFLTFRSSPNTCSTDRRIDSQSFINSHCPSLYRRSLYWKGSALLWIIRKRRNTYKRNIRNSLVESFFRWDLWSMSHERRVTCYLCCAMYDSRTQPIRWVTCRCSRKLSDRKGFYCFDCKERESFSWSWEFLIFFACKIDPTDNLGLQKKRFLLYS